jgi:hypothetical protein
VCRYGLCLLDGKPTVTIIRCRVQFYVCEGSTRRADISDHCGHIMFVPVSALVGLYLYTVQTFVVVVPYLKWVKWCGCDTLCCKASNCCAKSLRTG